MSLTIKFTSRMTRCSIATSNPSEQSSVSHNSWWYAWQRFHLNIQFQQVHLLLPRKGQYPWLGVDFQNLNRYQKDQYWSHSSQTSSTTQQCKVYTNLISCWYLCSHHSCHEWKTAFQKQYGPQVLVYWWITNAPLCPASFWDMTDIFIVIYSTISHLLKSLEYHRSTSMHLGDPGSTTYTPNLRSVCSTLRIWVLGTLCHSTDLHGHSKTDTVSVWPPPLTSRHPGFLSFTTSIANSLLVFWHVIPDCLTCKDTLYLGPDTPMHSRPQCALHRHHLAQYTW